MTEKQKKNLIRLLKASNPASRKLGEVLLENSDLSKEEKSQLKTDTVSKYDKLRHLYGGRYVDSGDEPILY